MSLSDYLFLLICGLGVINSAVLAIYFIIGPGRIKTFDYFLAFLLLCFGIRMAKHILVYFNQDVHLVYHIVWYFCFAFSAPLFFMAVKKIMNQSRSSLPQVLIQFIIPLPFFLLYFFNELWAYYSILALFFVYLLISSFKFYNWRKEGNWTQAEHNMIFSLMVFITGIIAIHLYSLIYKISFFSIEALFFSFFIYLIVYRRFDYLKQLKRTRTGKSAQAPLPSMELSRYKQQVINYFIKSEAYLKPQTSLPETAKELKMSHHLLSKVINEAFNLNFNDYINQYRIEHSMRLLKNSNFDQFTISHIAEKSGFASTSAFNAAFKKFAKTTPSEYRQLKKK